VRAVPAGTPVGYGHAHVTSEATRLALLPLGYADGVPRSSKGFVAIQQRRCPVVGRVSMDQLVVDVGELPVREGDVATVFGPGDLGEPTTAEWAAWAGTIEHEIVTGIGARIRRTTVARQLRQVS
jgi:alanine racemase